MTFPRSRREIGSRQPDGELVHLAVECVRRESERVLMIERNNVQAALSDWGDNGNMGSSNTRTRQPMRRPSRAFEFRVNRQADHRHRRRVERQRPRVVHDFSKAPRERGERLFGMLTLSPSVLVHAFGCRSEPEPRRQEKVSRNAVSAAPRDALAR
jgi:hypothetical protein